jgi:hypothetical protein
MQKKPIDLLSQINMTMHVFCTSILTLVLLPYGAKNLVKNVRQNLMTMMVRVEQYVHLTLLPGCSMILLIFIIILALFPNKWTRVGALFQSVGWKWQHKGVLTLIHHQRIIQLEMMPGFIVNGRSSSPSY